MTSTWKISLHGGHSSRYCDHAHSTLEEVLDAAVRFGYGVFGVTEHAPRCDSKYLFEEERELGWDVARIEAEFRHYANALDALIPAYADRLKVLKGFEIEVVPPDRYREIMLAYRRDLNFDYIVGSVHYVDGIIIDYTRQYFEMAVEACGGAEALAVRYYQTVAEMVHRMSPEVVGHFDLVRKLYPAEMDVETPRIRRAAEEALEAVRERGAILDINTAAFRKGMAHPYPAPVYMPLIREMGIPVCFGDDSHSADQVGSGIEAARDYLLDHGISHITALERGSTGIQRAEVSLLERTP